MIKRITGMIAAALIVLLVLTLPVLASYYADLTVTETGGDDYTQLALIHSADIQWMADNNYITSTGLDTRVTTALGAELPHMLANGSILFVTPVSADSQANLRFTTGSTPLTSFPLIIGNYGNVFVADSASLELGNNFSISQTGYVNATTSIYQKYLITKWEAFRTYVSAANEITSEIYAFSDSSYNRTPNWEGDYTSASITVFGVSDHWDAVDDPVATPDDDSTYVETASTSYVKDAYELQNSTFPDVATIGSVKVHFRMRGTNAGVQAFLTPYLRLNGAESAGIEQGIWSTSYTTYSQTITRPGGGGWTGADIDDLQVVIGLKVANGAWRSRCTQVFVELVNVSSPSRAVTATGVSSGIHNITTTADETDLKIYVDGVEEDSTALNTVFVVDNSNGWTLMYQNSLIYATNTTISVDDVQQAWYQPVAIISGTVLPDREGTAQNGVITWGSNPAGVSTSLDYLISSDQLLPTASTGETSSPDMTGPTGQPDWTPTNLPTLASNPFYPLVNVISSNTGIPVGQIWIIAATLVVLTAMLACFMFVPHQLITVLMGGALTTYFWTMGIYPFWVIIIFVLGGLAIVLWERMPSV